MGRVEDVRILPAEGRPAVPWSNGGGVTREVAVHPPGAGWDAFVWRVSLADVTRDGPYSPLSGVRRILTVVDGDGLELTVDGTPHLLPGRHRPFSFSGAAATASRLLAGPVVNLNVMVREGRAAATVEMVRGSRAVAPGPGRDVLVVAVAGEVRLGTSGPRLARFDAALLTGGGADPGPVELRVDGVAAVIELIGRP
ncbi:HutD family protein [Streptomyces sp. NPDC048506]|uniref:HutD/Ves family protein n=1 Tax=Streptomyces sp. NPDC048506 TaxID=3155028 RepID=UPI00342525FF